MKLNIVILLFIPCICLGQRQYKTTNRGFLLKTNITSFVDQFSFPTIQFSVEKRVSHNFSIAGEIGYQLYEFKRYGVDTSFINKQGIKSNIEFRYYNILEIFRHAHKIKGDLTGTYLGINFFYRQNKYNTNVYYTKPNDNFYNDCFWVNKKIGGVNLVFGIQKKLSNRIAIDLYTGIGGMNRQSQNFRREYNNMTDSLKQPKDLTVRSVFDNTSLKENNGWTPNFNLGIRLGIRL